MVSNTDFKRDMFISPFIRTLAVRENISWEELYEIRGTGLEGRITKEDILNFLQMRDASGSGEEVTTRRDQKFDPVTQNKMPVSDENTEYMELSRVRKLIASHMVRSKHVAPHVTSFVEVNVTRIVNFRNRNKDAFQKETGESLTFMPFFLDAVIRAIKKYPTINASLQGDYLAIKKQIHIGIATALPDGNLIVPVLHNADNADIEWLALKIGDLSRRARQSQLKPDEVQGGTFTVTNVGSFGNLGGTPIINQPELAILAIGSIIKKPVAVWEGHDYGIALQDVVELWLSYDHRIVDGALGASFLKQIADNLTEFDDSVRL